VTANDQSLMDLKREELALEEAKTALIEGLPFLHAYPWYDWAHEFYESVNKLNFLCAANQISKSSTQIRKAINWATDKTLWPKLWRKKPRQFWYFYPSKDLLTIEFETKWKEFLPANEYKDDPVYGWKEVWKDKALFAIYFNSGIHLYFKTYAQKVSTFQAGSVDAVFCDEELPLEMLNEIMFRISATDGYFHMVFTATLGQDYWRRVIEPNNKQEEIYPDAWKRQISMYDCLFYMDGSPSPWTPERIAKQQALCSTKAEIQKRIYGKFVVVGGLKYETFDRSKNMKPNHYLPKDWNIYGGADYGSGGKDGHPSACVFVGVSPTYREGRVFKAWRGDEITTTAGDVVQRFLSMQGKMVCTGRYYDPACKDFDTIATSMHEPFEKAEKSHEIGEQVLNTLFKHQMLALYDGDPEIEKLAGELSTLKKETPKNKAKDDLCDALRYAVSQIPWDFTFITGAELPETEPVFKPMTQEDERRLGTERETEEDRQKAELDAEFRELNDLYEGN
jgi:hypothetical protein